MKKLLITMLAILAFNVSYAAQMGEEQGIPNGECAKTRGDAGRIAKEQVEGTREVREQSGSESIDG